MVVMGVANFNLEPIRSVDEWLWWVGEKELNVTQIWQWSNWIKGIAVYEEGWAERVEEGIGVRLQICKMWDAY